MKMNLAPIVLFVYNRPQHTKKTLEALALNDLAKESHLIVYADGPKADASDQDIARIDEVREIVRSVQWCGTVELIASEINKGLASSIISGVSSVLERSGKVIVLEDDLYTSKSFLLYMNQCLEFYKTRQTVFSVSAYQQSKKVFHIPEQYGYDVYVSPKPYPWGWGTWADRWSEVDWSMQNFSIVASDSAMVNAVERSGNDLLLMLRQQKEGKINSWWIRFYLHHFSNRAISIQPCVSLVQNIGMDDSGTHCNTGTRWDTEVEDGKQDFRLLNVLYENAEIFNSIYTSNTELPPKRSVARRYAGAVYRFIRKRLL